MKNNYMRYFQLRDVFIVRKKFVRNEQISIFVNSLS